MPGTDFLQLDPAAAPARGLTDWLTAAVRAAVLDGRLTAGDRLPATRTLAADLGTARGVVVEAYQRLVDEGLVAARPGAGTVVLPRSVAVPPRPAVATPAGPVRLPVPTDRPLLDGVIDLSPGVPDLAAFPRAAWLRAERAVLRDASAADLGYGDPRGSARLRGELAGWLGRTRGLQVAPEQVLVVAGVAQALALLAQTLRSRAAVAIAVEDPGSRGAREEFVHWGLRPVGVPVDAEGLVVPALPAVPAVVVTPAHQFPTGVVLSPARRRELLAWARDGGGLVVEDDYDAEHRYDRAPVPALQPSAPEHVAHTGSTSKTLAPGMRLGWLVAPAGWDADLVAAKHASDLGSPALPQLVLAELLRSGEYDRHLRRVRGRQRARRDALLAALTRFLPEAQVSGVAAGLHLLVTFPGSDADDVAQAASAREAGVVVHPLSWHRTTPGDPGLVIGYAASPPDRLHAAVERLARALHR
ncbi:Transcriptional regulator, GntR family protein [Modestobacter italicus]|uniref:Transcriptional regulator, GntR family protein n=1 Tax=Modestobacter italicus (strain DSM 44449 / CECT 9708 / BC 501) TaxID=2732864 RepID=I4EQG8_MODI5|nr:PLP-dependent aminotransferase family protein [Modestobacter marinus]CCH85631.1 Transcriptional regulator, GntR family protein [Modestobacter marinus]